MKVPRSAVDRFAVVFSRYSCGVAPAPWCFFASVVIFSARFRLAVNLVEVFLFLAPGWCCVYFDHSYHQTKIYTTGWEWKYQDDYLDKVGQLQQANSGIRKNDNAKPLNIGTNLDKVRAHLAYFLLYRHMRMKHGFTTPVGLAFDDFSKKQSMTLGRIRFQMPPAMIFNKLFKIKAKQPLMILDGKATGKKEGVRYLVFIDGMLSSPL